MLKNVLIDGTSVNIAGARMVTGVTGGGAPVMEMNSYNHSGGSGVTLGKTCYRSLSIGLSVTVTATSVANLAVEKQRLLSLLSVDPDGETTTHNFTFVLSNDVNLTAVGAVTAIDQQLTPANCLWTQVNIQIQTEKAYLMGAAKSVTLGIANLGGMSVPMTLPMAMNLNAGSELYTQLNNAGNAYSHLAATINGPCAGMILLNSTREKRWQSTQNLAAGETLTVDFYRHTALVNNNINVLQTISGNWWSVAPGTNEVLFAANDTTGATTATLNFYDAYLGI